QSALAQPQATFGGQFLHHDIIEMAAAYLFHNNRDGGCLSVPHRSEPSVHRWQQARRCWEYGDSLRKRREDILLRRTFFVEGTWGNSEYTPPIKSSLSSPSGTAGTDD